ncbi:MAG: pilin [Candidatus Saccharibacteria bacterium]|nr:pilin [Candidatus Saccharibacteria bacterium]
MKSLFKKILVIVAIVLTSSVTISALGSTSAHATDYIDSTCDYTLGFTSWNCGVSITDDNSLKTGIWHIAANIATDITVAAAYLVLGYVIYGGYLYTFSGGDPGKVATGKKNLYQAFLGLAIVLLAYVIMNSIRFALLGANGSLGNCMNINESTGAVTDSGCIKASTVISGAITWAISIAGVISAIFVVYGGISYATSAGDPGKLQKAKSMITYALIGLAIVALAQIITAFVTGIINNAT